MFMILTKKLEKIIDNGGIITNSPKELLNEVDIVVSMVFGPKEIEDVLKGKNGMLQTSCKDKDLDRFN